MQKNTNQLFETLLGEDASALVSKDPTKGDGESTQMSSILGPLRDKEEKKSFDNNNNNTPQGGNKKTGMLDYNNNNNGKSNNNNNRHHTTNQTRRQSNEETQQTFPEDQTLDTFMTKPREIKFDANDDDVSALFGGGGASQLGGVESYRGTYAKKRQGKGNIVMGGNNNYNNSKPKKRNIEEDSRRTGGTSTFQSHGVNSILEEIGLRTKSPSSYNKKRESFSEEDETWDEGGDESAYPQSRTVQSRLTRGTEMTGQSTTPRRRKRNSSSGGLGDIKTKNMIVAIVGIVFITIQFTTVNKRDRHVMQSMKQQGRFNNRYATAPHARGQEGLSNADMEKMRRMAEGQANQRRRGGSMAQQNDEDGLGDVLRKTVPLVGQPHKKESWEREQIMFDDAIEDNQRQQLRGNKKMSDMMNQKQKLEQQKLQQQMKIQQQQLDLQKKQMQLQQQQMAQQQQQMAIPKQQDPPQVNQQQQLSPPQKQMEVGDTHPLLAPGKLSMEKGPDIVGADKLADIDPRPQQSLSNDIIPKRYQVFADLRTPYTKGRDTPFFWHIPRSGGVIVKTMLSHCLGQTLAAEVGEMDGHGDDTELKVISFADHNYTNVNVATPEGITRALNLGLVPSHKADTIVSAHVDLIPSLFNGADRARAFVVFRNPIDRAASMFYFLKGTGYPPLKNMTIDDYAKSELIENNWLVRILSESMTGPIDMDNLEVAKEVLRRKFIVGLLDNKRGTFARFDHYFKWKESPDYQKEFGCRKQLMDEKYTPRHPIRKDSDTWKLLHEQNRFDVHLYEYSKELFQSQSFIFGL